jgi:hypothetical protein
MLLVFGSFLAMRFCCKTSNFNVDTGHPLALLSVLFAIFVRCVRSGFFLFVVKGCSRVVCVLLFSYDILLRCVFFLLSLAVLVPSVAQYNFAM